MFPINNRIKDVIITLKVANDFGEDLGRLRLQKFIYLGDIISVYWGLLNSSQGHKTYKNGPYDSDIQNAVDMLAFRGFVKIKESNYKEDNTVTASYGLTPVGIKLYKQLEKSALFKTRVDLYSCIGVHVNQHGWKNLKKIVYQEPTYCYNKANGWGHRLDYSSLFTNDTLRILDGFQRMFKSDVMSQLTVRNITSIYFKLLVSKL